MFELCFPVPKNESVRDWFEDMILQARASAEGGANSYFALVNIDSLAIDEQITFQCAFKSQI